MQSIFKLTFISAILLCVVVSCNNDPKVISKSTDTDTENIKKKLWSLF